MSYLEPLTKSHQPCCMYTYILCLIPIPILFRLNDRSRVYDLLRLPHVVAGDPQQTPGPGLSNLGIKKTGHYLLYVQEVVTQPKILNRTILSNLIHVTSIFFAL